ncbi:MAG: DUF4249 family protein [Salibacteraceae bacterium]
MSGIIGTGCQEVIELDLPANDPELVVEGYLTQRDYIIPESDLDCSGIVTISKSEIELAVSIVDAFINIDSIENQTDYFPFNKVQLSTTTDYFSNGQTPRVSNAKVRLFENGELTETLLEDPNEPGTYRINHLPKLDASYHLEIDALGNFYETEPETYRAVPPLLRANAVYKPNFTGDTCAYYLGLDTYEKKGKGDFYRWMFYRNNQYNDSPFFISTFDDQDIDGVCLFEFDIYGDELQLGDTLIVFQIRTSEGYYNFINSLRNQTAFVGSPFDSPPAPIKGNVKNISSGERAFGYFMAGGISANAAFVPDSIPSGGCE